MKSWITLLVCALGLCLVPAARAQFGGEPRATLESALNVDGLRPGSDGLMAVIVDIGEGYHAQSHTPLTKNLRKLRVEMKENSAVAWSDPVFPQPRIEEYGGEKLSVYTGRVTIYVPFKVKPDAKPGPVELTGLVEYQICNDQGMCFAPERPPLKIQSRIVSAADAVKPLHPEIFEGYKASPEPPTPLPPGPARGNPPATRPATRPAGAAAELDGPPPDLAGPDAQSRSVAWAISAAFLAGLIFNVMPCVLPVLPLKAMSFFEAAQHDRSRSFMLGVVFSLGVITFFAALAIPILVFRKLTWGQQFSNPYFVWGITILMLAMAAGMFGFFNVSLPTSVYNFTPRHDSYTGNFLSGIFTALLATPCTAPLLPPLLTWALSQPVILGVSIMIVVGIGMAIPYLVLSGLPEVARRFPRTGPWSELVKQMLGFLLLAFAVYFAAGNLIHGPAFWWWVLAVVAVACLYLMGRTVQFSKSAGAMAASSIIAVSLFGVVLIWAVRANGLFSPQASWTPYTRVAFDQARADGKVVLIKFTANWCVTCQAIEATVFADQDVWKEMHDQGVVMLKADMTDDNPQAEELLRQLNPAGGIPLTAIYSPKWGRPLKLESQYTSGTLLRAISKAAPHESVATTD